VPASETALLAEKKSITLKAKITPGIAKIMPKMSARRRELFRTSPARRKSFCPYLRAASTCVPVARLENALVIAQVARSPRLMAARTTSVFSRRPTMAVSTTETTIWEERPATAGVEIFRTSRVSALSGNSPIRSRCSSGGAPRPGARRIVE